MKLYQVKLTSFLGESVKIIYTKSLSQAVSTAKQLSSNDKVTEGDWALVASKQI